MIGGNGWVELKCSHRFHFIVLLSHLRLHMRSQPSDGKRALAKEGGKVRGRRTVCMKGGRGSGGRRVRRCAYRVKVHSTVHRLHMGGLGNSRFPSIQTLLCFLLSYVCHLQNEFRVQLQVAQRDIQANTFTALQPQDECEARQLHQHGSSTDQVKNKFAVPIQDFSLNLSAQTDELSLNSSVRTDSSASSHG